MIPGAFWYLFHRSARNRLIRQLDRLKEPRYAIALLVGIAYLWFFLFQRRQPGSTNSNLIFSSLIPLLGSLGLFLALVRWWIFGGNQAALTFAPAEIHFLFPAPISRNALIRWKLLRSQVVILINALIWITLTRRTRPDIPAALHLLALWMLFSTLSLHRLGATLARAGLETHWRTGFRHQLIPVVLVVAAIAGLGLTIASHWAELRIECCGRDFWPLLDRVLREPMAAAVLYPFRLLLAPVTATTVSAWFAGMVPAVGALAIHYVWVMRSDAAFEEAALQASAEMARRTTRFGGNKAAASPRRRTARAWFPLASQGWPGTAILWKNLLSITRGTFSRSTVLGIAILGAAIVMVLSTGQDAGMAPVVGAVGLMMGGLLAFLGPAWIRNDLRQDLAHLGLLRTYPLTGRTIVLAEVAASTITLTALQSSMLLIGYLGLRNSVEGAGFASLGAALLLIPAGLLGLNAIGMTVQNAGALLFPAWVRFDSVRPGSFETLGQNILSSGFTLLLTLVGLIVPVVTGWLTWWALEQTLGTAAVVLAMAFGTGAAALEMWVTIGWLGRVIERTESIR